MHLIFTLFSNKTTSVAGDIFSNSNLITSLFLNKVMRLFLFIPYLLLRLFC